MCRFQISDVQILFLKLWVLDNSVSGAAHSEVPNFTWQLCIHHLHICTFKIGTYEGTFNKLFQSPPPFQEENWQFTMHA
jgi:dihydroorotase-like cyclic amidohydrolase